jgi:hypothetical protein
VVLRGHDVELQATTVFLELGYASAFHNDMNIYESSRLAKAYQVIFLHYIPLDHTFLFQITIVHPITRYKQRSIGLYDNQLQLLRL